MICGVLGDDVELHKSNKQRKRECYSSTEFLSGLKVSIKDVCMVGQHVCLCGLDSFIVL